MTTGSDLVRARRLLPVGTHVTGTVSHVPEPGRIGVFVDLPDGMAGFVDVAILPRGVAEWPELRQTLRFEVLQHRPGQVRLWPLDAKFRRDDTTPHIESLWRQAKLRYPIGSSASARVVSVFRLDHAFQIKFTADDDPRWSYAVLPWIEQAPVVGDVGPYKIVAHLDSTRRIIVVPVE